MERCIPEKHTIELVSGQRSIHQLLEEKIQQQDAEGRDETFCISNLSDIIHKYEKWTALLPRVRPFYAVKCNDELVVLKLLADLGLSFDCASKDEIEKVLSLGVSPNRIIYANPCKQNSFIRYAAENNVSLMTFDNEDELYKIKSHYPQARLLIRILPPKQFAAKVPLGIKYGCQLADTKHLLKTAKCLGLKVVGVSFHVGSGCEESIAYTQTIEDAREVFNIGSELGFEMSLLDVGGGFPGQEKAIVSFEEIVEVLNTALDRYFPSEENVDVIAEPGRYFVMSAFTLVVTIIGKRIVYEGNYVNGDGPSDNRKERQYRSIMYYVNDGIHGVFNGLQFDENHVGKPCLIQNDISATRFNCSIWGPTCNGSDYSFKNVQLPDLPIGSRLYFENMGAYTLSLSSSFNGIPPPSTFYICRKNDWNKIYTDSPTS